MTMIEFVFRPVRRKDGKIVRSRLFCGRYNLARGEPVVLVSLDTPDEAVARKKLRDLIVEKQRARVGLEFPELVRETLGTPLAELLCEYEANLTAQGRSASYVRDTLQRLRRMAVEIGWQFIADIRPDRFERWFWKVKGSLKTKREYQLSARAFLNWLLDADRIERNPLRKLKLVSSRGREVRPSRRYENSELRALFGLANERTLFYLMLLYTAGRKNEVGSLVWSDLELPPRGGGMVVFRDDTTKAREERAVPLNDNLCRLLRRVRGAVSDRDGPVFLRVPRRKSLLADLVNAAIERKNAAGRVVHFHAFRKTARTLAVGCAVPERVIDAILGHANPNRMGTRYTDPTGLPLREWLKLPWFGPAVEPDAQLDAQRAGNNDRVRELITELAAAVHQAEPQGVCVGNDWSGRQDSNLRPPGPKPGALPG